MHAASDDTAAILQKIAVAAAAITLLYRRVLAGVIPAVELRGVNRLGGMIRPAEILEAL